MQKVEGSSPFSRLKKTPAQARFFDAREPAGATFGKSGSSPGSRSCRAAEASSRAWRSPVRGGCQRVSRATPLLSPPPAVSAPAPRTRQRGGQRRGRWAGGARRTGGSPRGGGSAPAGHDGIADRRPSLASTRRPQPGRRPLGGRRAARACAAPAGGLAAAPLAAVARTWGHRLGRDRPHRPGLRDRDQDQDARGPACCWCARTGGMAIASPTAMVQARCAAGRVPRSMPWSRACRGRSARGVDRTARLGSAHLCRSARSSGVPAVRSLGCPG
jgi:hypothetical protein